MDFDSKYVEKKLATFPIFLKYVGPSLIERGNCDNWYENGFIFDIYTDLDFVKRFDRLLNEVNSVIDIGEIFVDLKGDDEGYDLKIFDVFAEIRSVIWAHKNDLTEIQKIPRTIYNTPDFRMSDRNGKKIVMEVKHIRSGNPFHDLASARARGLILINGLIGKIGSKVEETEKYLKYQHRILAIQHIYQLLAGKLRNQLSSEKIIQLSAGSIEYLDLLNNLLKIKTTYVGTSSSSSSLPVHPPGPSQTLQRLIRDVDIKKEQLNRYIEAISTNGRQQFDEGIIFVTGISEEQDFWFMLSEELDNSNSGVWATVPRVFTKETLIPTRIISNFGMHDHDIYHDFPRNHDEYAMVRNE